MAKSGFWRSLCSIKNYLYFLKRVFFFSYYNHAKYLILQLAMKSKGLEVYGPRQGI